MAYLQRPMLIELLSRVEFDTESGCWFGPDGTYYHGRAIWFLWFGEKDPDYCPALLCEARFVEDNMHPCINPEHVSQQRKFVAFAERVTAGKAAA